MLLRLTYLGITNAFAHMRLLPRSDWDKDAEILVLRHQLAVLQRQLGGQQVQFQPADRAWLAALLHHLSGPALRGLRLLVQPGHDPALAPRARGTPPRGEVAAPPARPAAYRVIGPFVSPADSVVGGLAGPV